NETVIEYYISENTANASIMIFDLNGKLLKTNNITGSGKGSITIFGNELSQGMYLYSLVINGEERDTKRMILSE
ncbi:MAG TPA: secretion protein Por, partial [Bacteroidales bacterium]|nr:secretion protein Por [Bacteroidales bacterium]